MRRRSLLSALGTAGLGALAGCLQSRRGTAATDRRNDDGTDARSATGSGRPTSTPRPMGATVDVDGGTVRVSTPRVQRTYVYDNSVWQSVEGKQGYQFLLVDVDPSGFERPRTSWLDVALDGRPLDAESRATTGDAGVVDGGVAIPVPVRSADSATVRWKDEARWRLPESIVRRFASAPEFAVRNATYEWGTGLVVTVANEGDRDGRFRLWMSAGNAYDISHVASTAVAAGTETTFEVPAGEIDGLTPTPGRELELHWGTGGRTLTLPTTPTPDG